MNVEADETAGLIGSDKVQDTAVYNADDQQIGSIERVMIEKVSGRVSYAVLSFGGFLGIGTEYYPLPWTSLKYDESIGGYRLAIPLDQLEKAPKYANDSEWAWTQHGRIDDYYGARA
jgi:hypothetical protein